MPQQSKSVPLRGGLDLVTAPFKMPAGRLIAALNYEPCEGGYRRLAGCERFDGRARPSDTDDAATKAARRAAIGAVPGTGPVRGVVLLPDLAGGGANDVVYAFRDNTPDMGCFRARPSALQSWTAVTPNFRLGFTTGGAGVLNPGATVTGGVAYTARNVVLRQGDWTPDTARGFVVLAPYPVGLNLTINHTYSGGNFSPAATTPAIKTGGYSGSASLFHGRFDFDVGTFTGAASERVYAANGLGCAFELYYDAAAGIDVITPISVDESYGATAVDKPSRVAIHRNHLFLGFDSGSLTNSETLNPYAFSAVGGALETGFATAITNLVPEVAGALLVTGKDRVGILYGSDASNFELSTPGGEDAGGVAWTAQKAGRTLYFDAGGLRDLATTDTYGNFSVGTLTKLIKPLLDTKRAAGITPTASMTVRGKDQYRLFFDDGSGLVVYFGGSTVEILPIVYPFVVSCAWSGLDGAGHERLFVGAADGFVYELDRGDSFDGEPITYFARTAFDWLGAVNQDKRLHKVTVELDCGPNLTLGISAEVSYADPETPSTGGTVEASPGRAGFWDSSLWDSFYWSTAYMGRAALHLDGIGENLSILVGATDAAETPSHTLTGYTVNFSPRKLRR